MLRGYETGVNRSARPDIITCNSVLNALAYEPAETTEEKSERMRMAVDTLETFQRRAHELGRPNHVSYANMLACITAHVDAAHDVGRRAALTEATFLQCCEAGLVSVPVVAQLHRAVTSFDRFRELLDGAVYSQPGDKLGFNLLKLPPHWTRYAPVPGRRRSVSRGGSRWSASGDSGARNSQIRRDSPPSPRRRYFPQVTKVALPDSR
jgi:hypothetical protein